jgi:hypothetical protein
MRHNSDRIEVAGDSQCLAPAEEAGNDLRATWVICHHLHPISAVAIRHVFTKDITAGLRRFADDNQRQRDPDQNNN